MISRTDLKQHLLRQLWWDERTLDTESEGPSSSPNITLTGHLSPLLPPALPLPFLYSESLRLDQL